MPNSPSQQASKARDSWKPVKILMTLCPEANVKGNQARAFLKVNPDHKPTLLSKGNNKAKGVIAGEFIKFCEEDNDPVVPHIFTHLDRPPTTRPSQGDPTRPPRAGGQEKRSYNKKEPPKMGFWAVLADLRKLQAEHDLNIEQLEDCLLIMKEVEIVGKKNRSSLRRLQNK